MNTRRDRTRAGAGSPGSRQRGFTLVEIIVAFAILALGLTLLLGTLSGATRQLREGGEASRAALHAHALLVEHASLPRQALSAGGELEEGRYRWRLQAEPWQDPEAGAGADPVDPAAPRLLRVRLDIEWDEGGPRRHLQVASLRLVSSEGLPP